MRGQGMFKTVGGTDVDSGMLKAIDYRQKLLNTMPPLYRRGINDGPIALLSFSAFRAHKYSLV